MPTDDRPGAEDDAIVQGVELKPGLAETLAALERYGNKGSEMMNLGPARVALMSDAARLLRAMAEDFSFLHGHHPACDLLHWEKRECTCGLEKAISRWRLP